MGAGVGCGKRGGGVRMIGAISLMRRRHDIGPEQFSRHWLDVHGPLVLKMPGLQRYQQAHVIAALSAPAREMEAVNTPGTHTVQQVAEFLGVGAEQVAKTLIYLADGKPVAAVVRGGGSRLSLGNPPRGARLPAGLAPLTGPAAAATLRLRPGFVDAQRTASHIGAVQRLNGAVRRSGIRHLDKGEASRTSGVAIRDQAHALNGAERLEQGADRFLGSSEIQVSHVNVLHTKLLHTSLVI